LEAILNDHRNEDAGKPDVVVYPGLSEPALAGALMQSLTAAAGGALTLSDSLDALERAAADAPQARIVIVFTRPDIDIGQALANGVDARAALDDWEKRTGALLDIVRRHRRRMVLIDVDTLFSDPERAKTVLGVRIESPVDKVPEVGSSPLLRLIGQALLAQDAAAAALAGELIANSQGGESGAINPQEAQNEFSTLQAATEREKRMAHEAEHYKAQLADRQEEHDSVLTELFALQEKLKASRADLERKIAQVLQLGQGLESTEAQIRQLTEALNTQRARHEEESRQQASEWNAKLSEQEARHAEATRKQVETLEESLITLNKRMQALQKLEATVEDLKQQVSERDATLAEQEARHTEATRQQARMIEESLSALNERGAALEALNAEADTLRRLVQDKGGEVEILTGRLAKSDDTLRAREAELRAREAELRARDAEIAGFYMSKSYRMTAPLRWIRAALSGQR